MATKAKQDKPEKSELDALKADYYTKMRPNLGDDPIDEITDSLLESYTLTCAQLDILNAQVARDGMHVRTAKGMVEHPMVNTIHKLNADKSRFFTPLKRIMDKRAKEAADNAFGSDDEFMGF